MAVAENFHRANPASVLLLTQMVPTTMSSSQFSLSVNCNCGICTICAVSVPFKVWRERGPYLAMIAIRAKWWTGRCKLWELCNLGPSLTVNSENGHKRFEERPIQKCSDNCQQFNELDKFHFSQAIIHIFLATWLAQIQEHYLKFQSYLINHSFW